MQVIGNNVAVSGQKIFRWPGILRIWFLDGAWTGLTYGKPVVIDCAVYNSIEVVKYPPSYALLMCYFSVHVAKIQRPDSLPTIPEKKMGGRFETFFTVVTNSKTNKHRDLRAFPLTLSFSLFCFCWARGLVHNPCNVMLFQVKREMSCFVTVACVPVMNY